MSNFISVDQLYYAVEQTDPNGGTATYGTPKPIGKAVKISIDTSIAQGEFYGDGSLAEVATQFVSAKVSLETEVMPLSVIADILGHQLDGAGGLIYSKTDYAPNVALMYRRKKGNSHYRYVKIFKCKFADGKEDGETVSNSLKFQDDTIDGVAYARYSDGLWRTIKDQDETGYTADVSTTWFQSVNGTSTPITCTVNPLDEATSVATSTAPVLTFSTNLNASTVTTDNVFMIKASDATKVNAPVVYNDSAKTITLEPAAALSTSSGYIIEVTKNVKDTAGNTLANVFTSNFTTAAS